MKRGIVIVAGALLAGSAFAYQVTGPVLDVNDKEIVVEKGKEKWRINRDKDTKVSGDLKKGAKVTVEYEMTASKIDVKDGGKSKDSKADAKKSDKAADKPEAKKSEKATATAK